MYITDATANGMLDQLGTVATHVTLGTQFSTDGTGEVAGSGGRQSITWGSAASRNLDSSNTPQLTGVADGTYGWLFFFDAVSGGNYRGCAPRGGGTAKGFTAATTDTITCPAHGFANDATVVPLAIGGGSLPTGLTQGATYYVINATTDTFQLSLNQGGAAVDITAAGFGKIQAINPLVLSGGPSNVNIDDADLGLNF